MLEREPAGFSSLLMALQEYLAPPQIVILRGAPGATAEWQHKLLQHYLPSMLMIALEGELSGLPETLAKPYSRAVRAWVCQGVKCLPLIEDCRQLIEVCQTGGTVG